ncbi:MAG TPA: Jag N-terminal domain-containing protein [Candidatus Binatia bacterium]
MRFVEGEGSSIDEAIARALQALGATRDQVEIDIIENAGSGFLGFGRRPARVRATVRAPLVWQDVEIVARDGASAPPARGRGDGAEPRPAARPAPSTGTAPASVAGGFDAAAFLTETLRRMGWSAAARPASHGDLQVVEITSDDPEVAAACGDEVVRALGFLLNRVAERQGHEGTRFEVVFGSGTRAERPQGPARRAPEQARSHRRERRGGGRPRR